MFCVVVVVRMMMMFMQCCCVMSLWFTRYLVLCFDAKPFKDALITYTYIFVRSSYLFALKAIHFSELYCFVFEEFRTTSNSDVFRSIKTTFKTRNITLLIFTMDVNIMRKSMPIFFYWPNQGNFFWLIYKII